MRNDYDGELSALRHIVSSLFCAVRDIADATKTDTASVEYLQRAQETWHKWRTERFEREIKDAEDVLSKADSMSDYGAPWGSGRFVTRPPKSTDKKGGA